MKTYTVKALDSDGKIEAEGYEFELQDLDTVLALKIALEKSSGRPNNDFSCSAEPKPNHNKNGRTVTEP